MNQSVVYFYLLCSMAKQIKTIQCPKCGSTEKKELKPDFFKCTNCGTDYYLDNDDININENYSTNANNKSLDFGSKKVRLFIALLVGFLLLAFILPMLFSSSKPTSFTNPSTVEKDKDWWGYKQSLFTSSTGAPMMIVAGDRNKDDIKTIAIIDIAAKKEIKSMPIQAITNSNNGYAIYTFIDNSVYVIVNEQDVFMLNKADYTVSKINSVLASKFSQLSSGIATASFFNYSDGEGIRLKANDGIEYSYYPMSNAIYTGDERRKVQDNLWEKSSIDSLMQVFQFFKEKEDWNKDDALKLKTYYTIDDRKGPVLRQGVYSMQRILAAKANMLPNQPPYKPLVFKDITPGRKYFKPTLHFYDERVIIISSLATPSDNSPKQLQGLSTQNGTVLWTIPLGKLYLWQVDSYNDGYMYLTDDGVHLISFDGKPISEFKKRP